MAKKFSLLLAVVVVLVAAVPTMASASKGLEETGFGLLKINTQFNLTNVGIVTTTATGPGNITCKSMTYKAEVTKNNATEGFAGKAVGEGASAGCFNKGVEFKTTKIRLTNIRSEAGENGSGKATLSYEADLPGGLVCQFSGTNIQFSYAAGGDTIKFFEQPLAATPAGCTTATLDGEFTLETTVTPFTPILID